MLEKGIKKGLTYLVIIYRAIGSVFFGGNCRFEPSCSQYALDALKSYPSLKALKLILVRLGKCHPMGSHGYDPIPKNTHNKKHKKEVIGL